MDKGEGECWCWEEGFRENAWYRSWRLRGCGQCRVAGCYIVLGRGSLYLMIQCSEGGNGPQHLRSRTPMYLQCHIRRALSPGRKADEAAFSACKADKIRRVAESLQTK